MYVEEPPAFSELFASTSGERFAELVGGHSQTTDYRDYLHWDRLRRLDPPEGLTHQEWWLVLKWNRRPLARRLRLHDTEGNPFTYGTPDLVLRMLHRVDQRCSGQIAMSEVVTADSQARQHYLVNSLMEEAIRSSQLEGAATSRRVAKALLRSGREPRDRSERMIANNYRALLFMRNGIGERLTVEAILELHRLLTDGTMDDATAAGRMQTPDEERVVIFDREDGRVIHEPPPAEELPERLTLLCDFANAPDDEAGAFVHPVVRAVLLHFWLAYDHPFEDGNGRTARALFYWYMRQRGYRLTEYLSVSNILRSAPAKYTRAFLQTETDAGDTTYFLVHQLKVIERAVEELDDYLSRKAAEIRDVENLIRGSTDLNHRQLALLSNAVRHPETRYTFATHAASHGVTHETARTDLLALDRLDLLSRRKSGRTYVFFAPADLSTRLRDAGFAARD